MKVFLMDTERQGAKMNRQNDLAIICVTRNGRDLGVRLSRLFPGSVCYAQKSIAGEEDLSFDPPLSDFVTKAWGRHRAFVFIMATGIVVRVISSLISDKQTDPAVLVIDEKGRHVISLLSGHLGGANALTQKIAQKIGADPVITTATDLSGLPAVELWAREKGLVIENQEGVKKVNAALVNGASVGMFIQEKGWLENVEGPWESFDELEGLFDSECRARIIVSNRSVNGYEKDTGTLFLRPRNLVLGIGCNRGTSGKEIRDFVVELFEREGMALQSVAQVASIENKKDEKGLQKFAERLGVPLVCYTRDELNAMPDGSGPSVWAKKELGVKGVCEQAAMKGAGTVSLVVPKAISGNVTAAVAESKGVSILSD